MCGIAGSNREAANWIRSLRTISKPARSIEAPVSRAVGATDARADARSRGLRRGRVADRRRGHSASPSDAPASDTDVRVQRKRWNACVVAAVGDGEPSGPDLARLVDQ
jgi:hypothetical protein